MPLSAGDKLGPYEILSPLGAGGMGEVYRARDPRLGRDVAIKVLSAAVAGNPESLARFQREARVLASLNHPHIATIFGVEEHALVMELVEGPTLESRVLRGPMPPEEALPIALQLAQALEYAHDRGIIHRDLKPANIKLTRDGVVKILDFGLAKALATDVTSDSEATETQSLISEEAGRILGTPAYMSPEQARGKPLDRRTDIWAWGVTLFEMITGSRLYQGDTAVAVLAAIIERDPDLQRLNSTAPPALRSLIARCLVRDASRRLQAIGEARIVLEDLCDGPIVEPANNPAANERSHSRPYWGAALLAATCILAAMFYLGVHRVPSPAPVVRFRVDPPGQVRFNFAGPQAAHPVISPDGRRIVFGGVATDGKLRLYLRSLDSLTPQSLPDTDGASQPFWSPDSQWVAFFAGGKLKKISITGANAVTLGDAPLNRGGAWNSDGFIVFAPGDGPLYRLSELGGVSKAVTALDPAKHETSHAWPFFLPGNRSFLFLAIAGNKSSIRAGFLDGSASKPVIESQYNALWQNDYLLTTVGTTLMAQHFDPRTLSTSGDRVPIAEDVEVSPGWNRSLISVSGQGHLLYATSTDVAAQLVWIDRSGREQNTIGEVGFIDSVELSPDRKLAAVTITDPNNHKADIWVVDVSTGHRSRLTFGRGNNRQPVWSPDGRFIYFGSNRNGRLDLFRKQTSGAAEEELVYADPLAKLPTSWSIDGKHLLFYSAGGATGLDMWSLDRDSKTPRPFQQSATGEFSGHFSPSGSWVAYASDELNRLEIFAAPYNEGGGGAKRQITTKGGANPRWRGDGKEIFYQTPDGWLAAVPISIRGENLEAGVATQLFAMAPSPLGVNYGYQWDASDYGQRFLVRKVLNPASAESLVFVQNWTSFLANK